MEAMDPNRKLIVITYVGVWVKVPLFASQLLHAWKPALHLCLQPLNVVYLMCLQ